MSPDLVAEAEDRGVATTYEDWAHRTVEVGEEAVRWALDLLGPVDHAAPHTLTARPGSPVDGTVLLEDGGTLEVRTGDPVPTGYHQVRHGGRTDHLIAAPAVLPDPLAGGRGWGWMVQLYSLRSATSWGAGDYGDLAALVTWAAGEGADLVLVNPLHARAPGLPPERSPYFPASRRFADQLSLSVELLLDAVPDDVAARVRALRPPTGDLVDWDALARAKWAALQIIWESTSAGERATEVVEPLLGFAIWSALAEEHGRDSRQWPAELRGPGAVAGTTADTDRVSFHAWVQRRCDAQLEAAQHAARAAGMRIGLVHDLAVGVDPGGADAWALPDVLVQGAAVGAPPDGFNQLGQDWSLPPNHPDRLDASAHLALREVVRPVLRRGGGLRVDHALGLWRFWWVPAGRSAAEGTYVRSDADAALAVLAVEATRTGALIVGEDLGTVPGAVVQRLDAERVLGCDVLWFTVDDEERPLPPERWRADAAASISTHDLPTAAGWWASEPVRVRAGLGLLGVPEAEEEERLAGERDRWLGLLRERGLVVGAHPTGREVVRGLHGLLAATPCRVVLASLGDAVGDLRQPNLPGTTDEYPSWRLPVSDAAGHPLSLEQLAVSTDVAEVAELLRPVRQDAAP